MEKILLFITIVICVLVGVIILYVILEGESNNSDEEKKKQKNTVNRQIKKRTTQSKAEKQNLTDKKDEENSIQTDQSKTSLENDEKNSMGNILRSLEKSNDDAYCDEVYNNDYDAYYDDLEKYLNEENVTESDIITNTTKGDDSYIKEIKEIRHKINKNIDFGVERDNELSTKLSNSKDQIQSLITNIIKGLIDFNKINSELLENIENIIEETTALSILDIEIESEIGEISEIGSGISINTENPLILYKNNLQGLNENLNSYLKRISETFERIKTIYKENDEFSFNTYIKVYEEIMNVESDKFCAFIDETEKFFKQPVENSEINRSQSSILHQIEQIKINISQIRLFLNISLEWNNNKELYTQSKNLLNKAEGYFSLISKDKKLVVYLTNKFKEINSGLDMWEKNIKGRENK